MIHVVSPRFPSKLSGLQFGQSWAMLVIALKTIERPPFKLVNTPNRLRMTGLFFTHALILLERVVSWWKVQSPSFLRQPLTCTGIRSSFGSITMACRFKLKTARSRSLAVPIIPTGSFPWASCTRPWGVSFGVLAMFCEAFMGIISH